MYGAVETLCIRFEPLKKSTLVMVPAPPDVAFAVNEIVAGAVYVAPLAGAVIDTVGTLYTGVATDLVAEFAELPELLNACIRYPYVVPEATVVSL